MCIHSALIIRTSSGISSKQLATATCLQRNHKALCTLPIGFASAECKFSKMKLIKTRLRSTTNVSRLEHMMLLSCEGLTEINFDKAIDRMGTISPVYEKHLMPS